MEHQGIYRIQVVAEKTGLPAGTLRAWERRYGVPKPERSESEYRLYSARDVELVLRMKALVQGGLSPAEAAKLVLAEDVARPTAATQDAVSAYADAVDRILQAIRRFDVAQVEAEVMRTLSLGPALQTCDHVLVPVMRKVGELWHAGVISTAEEHFASETIGGLLKGMLRVVTPPESAPTIVLGCFAEELHAIGLHVLALQLAQAGYRPVVLGARTPPEAVARAVERLRPRLVALSVTILPPSVDVPTLVEAYARACANTPWMVGGRAAAAIASEVIARGGILAEPSHGDLRALLRRLPHVDVAS